jgi:hypothetical protein
MADELGWVARWQFLEDSWRGRHRLVFDPVLEDRLRAGSGAAERGGPAGPADLLDALLPREETGERVCVVLANPRRGAGYSRWRAGTTFVGIDEAVTLVDGDDWEVAFVELEGMLADPTARRGGAAQRGDPLARIDPRIVPLLEVIGEAAARGRAVVLSAPGPGDGGLTFPGFADLADELVPGARLFGRSSAAAALVYEFGTGATRPAAASPPSDREPDEEPDEGDLYDADLDAAEQEWTGDVEEEDQAGEDEEVPIDYDNTLGEREPTITGWIAVSAPAFAAEGLTVIELPREAPSAAESDDAGLRAQLAQAQRQADLGAIERQRLLEQLQDAEDRLDGGEGTRHTGVDDRERLDAALAREQALRWELEQRRGELELLRARAPGELEAEVARLQAQLRSAPPAAPRGGKGRATARTSATGGSVRLVAHVDRLLAKIERGGMPAAELHRALSRLRRRLSG